MNGKLSKILASLIVAMLLTVPVLAWDVPTQSHNADAMWMEDSTGSSNTVYTTTSAYVGMKFNLTMYLNTTVAQVGSWQFQMYYDQYSGGDNSTFLNVTRVFYSDPSGVSQLFAKAGTSHYSVTPTLSLGAALFAESYNSGPYPGSANCPASLCYIEFQILHLPGKNEHLYSDIDITTSSDTYIQDSSSNYYRNLGINSTVTINWVKPPSPGMGVKAPYTPFPTGLLFDKLTNWNGTNFDVPLYILGLSSGWTLANVSFTLNYNEYAPGLLGVRNIVFQSPFTGYCNNATLAEKLYVFASAGGAVSGDVIVCNVTFGIWNQPVFPAADATSVLNFDNTTMYDTSMLIGTTSGGGLLAPVNGGVTVQAFQSAPTPWIVVEPSTTSIGPAPSIGTTFCVDIAITHLSYVWRLCGVDFEVSYNPSVLSVVSIAEGPYFPHYNQSMIPPATVFNGFDGGTYVAGLDLILPDPNAPDEAHLYPAELPGGTTPPNYVDSNGSVVATICFRVIAQDVSCTPLNYTVNFNVIDDMAVGPDGIRYIPLDAYNASVTVYGSFETGRFIDVFTEYPAPYGGQGDFMPSDMFWPQKLVCLTAYVSYNCWPLQQKLVTFTIFDNNGNVWTQLTAATNTTGYAEVCFRMPWPCDNPESLFGVWSARADVDIACVGMYDIVTWHYDYIINIVKVTADKFYYNHGEYVCVNVNFTSNAELTYHVGMYVTIMDNLSYPIATEGVEFDIGGAQYCTPKQYWHDFCLYIPKFAAAGGAIVLATSRLYWDGRYSAEPWPVPQWVAAGPMATTAIYILPS